MAQVVYWDLQLEMIYWKVLQHWGKLVVEVYHSDLEPETVGWQVQPAEKMLQVEQELRMLAEIGPQELKH